MWMLRKLKLHQPVYLIRPTGWCSFSFLGLHILDLEHFKVSSGHIFFAHPLSRYIKLPCTVLYAKYTTTVDIDKLNRQIPQLKEISNNILCLKKP